MVGLQAAERFFQLLSRGLSGLAVNLGHEESLLPIAVPQRLTHADLTLATVVVPAVVECGANQADTQLLVLGVANMVAAESYHGNLLAGAAQCSIGKRVGAQRPFVAQRRHNGSRRRGF